MVSQQVGDLIKRFDRFESSQGELVRRDLYDAHRAAMAADIARVEALAAKLEAEADAREQQRQREADAREAAEVQNRSEWRRTRWLGLLGAAAAVMAAVLSPIVTVMVMAK